MVNVHITQLEQEIATLLLDKLEHLEITPERAAAIARFTLSHLPENLEEEKLAQIIPSLDDEYYELASIVHKHMLENEQKKEIIVNDVQALIKAGKLDDASEQMKAYFAKTL